MAESSANSVVNIHLDVYCWSGEWSDEVHPRHSATWHGFVRIHYKGWSLFHSSWFINITCMYVFVCVHLCMSVCACLSVYVYLHVCLCVHLCMSVYVYLYVCLCVSICVCLSVHVCLCINVCLCVSICVCLRMSVFCVCILCLSFSDTLMGNVTDLRCMGRYP